MIEINVLRKCNHLEKLTFSLGVTNMQIEIQRKKQQEKICLDCLTRKYEYEIEMRRREIS